MTMEPPCLEVEVTFFTPSTAVTEPSMGRVIRSSISRGPAPS